LLFFQIKILQICVTACFRNKSCGKEEYLAMLHFFQIVSGLAFEAIKWQNFLCKTSRAKQNKITLPLIRLTFLTKFS
jgi:hypothetical protein